MIRHRSARRSKADCKRAGGGRAKAAARRRLRPFRQGDLVGAVRGFDRAPQAVAHDGMSRGQLLKLVAVARATLAREHGLAIVVARVPRPLRRRWSVGVLWRLLEPRLARGEVAIIAIAGRRNHWTLVVAVNAGPAPALRQRPFEGAAAPPLRDRLARRG